jgi:ferritin-like metal-binding protein YciE
MAVHNLQDLYFVKLQLILDAEQQGLLAMSTMAQSVTNPELRRGLEMHRRRPSSRCSDSSSCSSSRG